MPGAAHTSAIIVAGDRLQQTRHEHRALVLHDAPAVRERAPAPGIAAALDGDALGRQAHRRGVDALLAQPRGQILAVSLSVLARMPSAGRSFSARMSVSASAAPRRSTQRRASHVGNEQRVASASSGSAGGAGSRSRLPRRANARSTALTYSATPGLARASVTASLTAAKAGTRSRNAS